MRVRVGVSVCMRLCACICMFVSMLLFLTRLKSVLVVAHLIINTRSISWRRISFYVCVLFVVCVHTYWRYSDRKHSHAHTHICAETHNKSEIEKHTKSKQRSMTISSKLCELLTHWGASMEEKTRWCMGTNYNIRNNQKQISVRSKWNQRAEMQDIHT